MVELAMCTLDFAGPTYNAYLTSTTIYKRIPFNAAPSLIGVQITWV